MRQEAPARNAAPHVTSTSAADASQGGELLPRKLGRYALLKLLVRGGMGEVFLATTIGIEGAERPCVVKRIRRDYRNDPSFRARFLDEARVQSQLDDPGVAHVLEATVDEHDDPYVVVEYVEGRSLADVRARLQRLGQPMPWVDAIAVTLEIASALAHVHERTGPGGAPLGIVHRDLSPQNVMVGFSGDVKLIDFGTARGDNRRCHTISGTVLAKPGYVAPEVARGEAATPRADIYALGVMLWEMVSGRRFLDGEATDHVAQVSRGSLRPAPLFGDPTLGHSPEGPVPAELDRLVGWLTEPLASARCPRAREAAQALASLLSRAPKRPAEERGVRARVKSLLARLYPNEPGASRVEFARHVAKARAALGPHMEQVEARTPQPAQEPTPSDAPTQFPEALPGTRYKLIRRLGEGAMGVVYEAEHIDLGRRVAVKVLHEQHSSSPEFVARFRREARAIASLAHPNLVHVYDFGQARETNVDGKRVAGRLFFAMEKLEGETLESYLDREGGVDWRDGCELAIKTCRALEAAHAAGLVHRDLKPANLFLTFSGTRPSSLGDAGLKLLDFGVAKGPADGVAAIGDESLSCAGAIFGTPDTMAPEQITGGKVDGRADLYALGCVLYELVTGRMPFDAPTSILLMSCHLRQPPTPPRLAAPERGIPEAVERAILRAMKKDAADRFANASELREALEEACFSAFFAEASTLAGSDVARSGHVVKAVDARGESVDVIVDDDRGSAAPRSTMEVLDDDLRPMSDASLSAIALDEEDLDDERERRLAARRRVVRPIGYLAIGGFGALALAALAQTHGQMSREEAIARFHGEVSHVAHIARDVAHRIAPDAVAASSPVAAAPITTPAAVEPIVAEAAADDVPAPTFRVVDAELPVRLLARLNAMSCEVPLRCDDDGASAPTLATAPTLAELPAARPTLADAEAKLAAHDAKGALAIARTLKLDATLASTRIWARSAYAAAEMKEAHEAAQIWIARAPDSDDDGLPARVLDARTLIAMGRLDDARARLDATLKTHPKSAEVRSLLRDLDRIEKIAPTDRADHPVAPPHPRTPRTQTKHRVAEKPPSKGQQ